MNILSYNVGLIDIVLLGRTTFEFARFTRLRATALGKYLISSGADVLCIQELFHQDDFKVVALELKSNYPNVYRTKRTSYDFLGSGLTIFSKNPIRHYKQHRFATQVWDEGLFAAKCFQIGEMMTTSGLSVTVVNVHTTAGGAFRHPESAWTNSVRLKQIKEFLSEVKQIGNENVLICGDLNCGPSVSPKNFQYILDCGYVDLVTELSHIPDFVTWDPTTTLNRSSPHRSSPPQRIDHILLSNKLHNQVGTEAYLRMFDNAELKDPKSGEQFTPSDHFGVLWKASLGRQRTKAT